jgi:PIN domain nuclease of toxin-antitoxin system
MNFPEIEIKRSIGKINLPFHYKDPFERMLISQSITRNLPIVTSDSVFKEYSVSVLGI